MDSFDGHIREAERLLKSDRPEDALPHYERALEVAPNDLVGMQVGNTVARIRELTGGRREAAAQFLKQLEVPYTDDPGIGQQRALALNNLGRLSLPQDPDAAIGYFDQSIEIYTGLSESAPRFQTHLAHSLMARGEAYYLKKKYWFSKKDYKAALELNRKGNRVLDQDMLAMAHYQLGAVYTDEFNAYDAQTNYQKALDCYLRGASENPSKYRPLIAACQNNLAVCHIQLEGYDQAVIHYQKALEEYQWLCQAKPETFLPYLAATYSSLGILYADRMKRYSEALLAGQKAISLYQNLAAKHPENYLHYLATAYHNSGIYTLETPGWKDASAHLSKALQLRKGLADAQTEAFGADYCVTALNLLEYYQRRLEVDRDLQYREKGLGLLEEMKPILSTFPGTPASVNMQNDFNFFSTYFSGINAQEIRTMDILEKIRLWDQEIDSTLDLDEKAGYQEQIVEILDAFFGDFPENTVLRKPFALALNNMAWLKLCNGDLGGAREFLGRAGENYPGLHALSCNLAHCELLEGNLPKAVEMYRALAGKKNESNKDFREIVPGDIKKLHASDALAPGILMKLEAEGILRPGG